MGFGEQGNMVMKYNRGGSKKFKGGGGTQTFWQGSNLAPYPQQTLVRWLVTFFLKQFQGKGGPPD